MNEEIQKLTAKLKRRENQMRSMQQIGKALSSVLNQQQLLILIMNEVTKLINAERGTLFLTDPEKGELWSIIAQKAEIKEIRLKIGVGIAGHVAKTGEIINIEDAYQDNRFDPTTDKKTGYRTRSILCMPIREPVKDERKKGAIIAVLQILNKINGIFAEEDVELLTTLASPIAISLVNARLYGNLEARVNELNLLFNIEKVMRQAQNTSEMLREMVHLISESLFTERGMILIYDAEKNTFPLRFAYHLDEGKLKEAAFSADEGIIGHVVNTGRIYLTNDIGADLYFNKTQARFFKVSIKNVICAPLVSDDAVVGIIELMNKKGDNGYFSKNDENLLESIAGHITRGIENFKLREEKSKADRLATIGNTMSALVHDLRTPMNNVYGFVDLMLDEDERETREEYAEIINEQIKMLTNMTTDVLDFAKGKTTILPRKYPVNKLIEEFVRFFEADIKKKGYHLQFAVNSASMLYIDPEKINRVFMNIMKNAIEAMDKGGSFSIMADDFNGEVLFRLSDTGKGIPVEIRDRLFDSFVTSGKSGGTGLGLAIVKKVVDEHKGRIEVESETGVGTTFKIYFPKI
jgi:signal transduction histidine kinase